MLSRIRRMNILITGSGGFVGRALLRRIDSMARPKQLERVRLVLFDVNAPEHDIAVDHRVVRGDLSDARAIESAMRDPIDVVFHLASVPGGVAEDHYESGRATNLEGTMRLLECFQAMQNTQGGTRPRFVFASSIAALGGPFNDPVDDDTPLRPQMSYGSHKQIGEILVRDASRRGWVEGLSLRLPGIVARPRTRTGQLSAFMSDVMHAMAAGEPYLCPVSPDATMWLMSAPCLVDNLLHAATLPLTAPQVGAALTLPTLRLSMLQLAAAAAIEYGADVDALMRYAPDVGLEEKFGRYPEVRTPAADRLGFAHDGDARTLVRRSLSVCHLFAASS